MKKVPIEDRFWSKVDMSAGENECWPWKASRDHKGYGWIAVERKMRRAHTIAYRLVNGEPPDGHLIRHTCDNPPCCNPKHLLHGTKVDNGRDASERNRFNPRYGELNPRAYLTEEIVKECRKRYVPRDRRNGVQAMARELGVNMETLRDAVIGRSWRHI